MDELWGISNDPNLQGSGSSYNYSVADKKKTPAPHRGKFIAFGAVMLVLCMVVSAVSGGLASYFVLSFMPVRTSGEADNTNDNVYMPDLAVNHEGTSAAQNEAENTTGADAPEPSTDAPAVLAPSQTEAPTEVTTHTQIKTKGEIYADSVDSIVGITAKRRESYETFFGYTATQEVTSTGSGFFVTENGYIVTNYHVIENAYDVSVTTFDGNSYPAEIQGYEAGNDIAVIKVTGTFPPVKLGSSAALNVGDDVLVIGNALGELSYTFTDGVVSYLNRTITTDSGASINMFQTNAAINEGNSGGPVYNMAGEVVGIASAKFAASSVEGLGFCIPTDDIASMINDIISYGYVTGKASMGISLQSVTQSMSVRYSLPVGCYVVLVGNGTASDAAGIESGDVITSVDGTQISSCDDISNFLSTKKAGDEISVTLSRNGEKITLALTLDEYVPAENRTQYSNVFDY